MIKLLNKLNQTYWEVWQDNQELVIHQGTVGERGDTKGLKLSLDQNPEVLMKKLANDVISDQGFKIQTDEDLTAISIQYPIWPLDILKALEKRHQVEDLMNECLGWTGNGYCDGGDIGQNTININCFVLDINKALKTIIEELKHNNFIEDVIIAYLSKNDYEVLFPPEGHYVIGE